MASSIETAIAEAGITAEAIAKARDEDGLSWRDVAKVLGLGNPSAARKAYSSLLGKDYHSSKSVTKRAPKGSSSSSRMVKPDWDNDTEPEAITDAIQGRRIWVTRQHWDEPECIKVREVLYYDTETVSGKPIDLTVTFIDKAQGAFRSVFVNKIVSVR